MTIVCYRLHHRNAGALCNAVNKTTSFCITGPIAINQNILGIAWGFPEQVEYSYPVVTMSSGERISKNPDLP